MEKYNELITDIEIEHELQNTELKEPNLEQNDSLNDNKYLLKRLMSKSARNKDVLASIKKVISNENDY